MTRPWPVSHGESADSLPQSIFAERMPLSFAAFAATVTCMIVPSELLNMESVSRRQESCQNWLSPSASMASRTGVRLYPSTSTAGSQTC